MRSILKVIMMVTLIGCDGSNGGDLVGAPFCQDTITPCAGSRLGERCALCQDADYTSSCQFPGTEQLDVCVASCDTCDGPQPEHPVLWTAPFDDPGQLVKYGVHVCWPARYRFSAWCARCPDLNATLTTQLCDKDGFCNPVVCVADCDACPLWSSTMRSMFGVNEQ